MSDPRVKDLPATIRAVGEHLGFEAARRLVEVFPGYRLQIPKRLPAEHGLRALGDGTAEALSAHFGGEQIDVPLSLVSRDARVRRVRELAARRPPPTLSEIAGMTGLTRSQVRRILAAPEGGSGPAAPKGRADGRDARQIDIEQWLSEAGGAAGERGSPSR